MSGTKITGVRRLEGANYSFAMVTSMKPRKRSQGCGLPLNGAFNVNEAPRRDFLRQNRCRISLAGRMANAIAWREQ